MKTTTAQRLAHNETIRRRNKVEETQARIASSLERIAWILDSIEKRIPHRGPVDNDGVRMSEE